MYYITKNGSNMSLSHMVKRLKDFRAIAGQEYLVRKHKKISIQDSAIPVYVGLEGGKLLKTSKKIVLPLLTVLHLKG
jgi:hypothetical protein